jgi:hypothetical protein
MHLRRRTAREQYRDNGLFPSGRKNGELHRTLLEIVNRRAFIALGKDELSLAIRLDLALNSGGFQIFRGVKPRFIFGLGASHEKPSAPRFASL